MTNNGQLGLYWGEAQFHIVETLNDQIVNILNVPFENPGPPEDALTNVPIPTELKLPSILEKALEFRSIKSRTVHLSLPTRDLIFRSFIIPWMAKHEIHSVIEFEITKYIPLKLDELTYTYHATPFSDHNQKSLRILFIAIRKTRLIEMTRTITEAGLELGHIEPAPICLLHLLKRNRLITPKDCSAVVTIEDEGTELMIYQDGTLTFMRKLNISVDHIDLSNLQNTLINEIRVSFNFFERQNRNDKVQKLIILSQKTIPGIVEAISPEFAIDITMVPISKFIPGTGESQSLAQLNALGATHPHEIFSTKFLDLSENAIAMQRSGKDPMDSLKRYGIMTGVVLSCALIFLCTNFFLQKVSNFNKNTINELHAKLGIFSDLNFKNLEEKRDEAYRELQNYTTVRTFSQAGTLLAEIPNILPDGAWLERLSITYAPKSSNNNPNLELELSGKIFSPDTNQQFYMLSEVVRRLKEHDDLNKFYGEVSRSEAERVTEDQTTITRFTIVCHPK